jgi:hypothetical protein
MITAMRLRDGVAITLFKTESAEYEEFERCGWDGALLAVTEVGHFENCLAIDANGNCTAAGARYPGQNRPIRWPARDE